MNLFIAVATSIVLASSIGFNNSKNGDEKTFKVVTEKKHAAIDKSVKPQVNSTIPATIVEEKYIAKVVTVKGDTIRYVPYFVERKIKY